MSIPLQQRAGGPGYRFGRYTLIRPLGVGGMAQVWLARKDIYGGTQKIVALKLPADLLGLDKVKVESLLNEIAITSQFSHSNIVHVFDAGVHRGVVYIELERVDGIDLDQMLHVMRMRHSPMSLGVAVYIWRSILEGLHYAYTYAREGKPHPVIHRDLNPSNVLISSSGEVKVMDFGIAKMLGNETSGAHIKGKIRYMPSEQARGHSSTRVDIYGTAAIFWELVEGKRFRDHVSPARMFDHVLSGAPEPITSPRVDDQLRQLYEKCTHKDPEQRPASPAEVLEELKLWLGRVADASDLRELYTWQLEAKRHSGFTHGDFEAPHDMIRMVEILRAIDQQEVESPRDLEPAPGLPTPAGSDAAADAPSFVRRPYRSSDFRPPNIPMSTAAPTEDAPIPGREPPLPQPPRAVSPRIEPAAAEPTRIEVGTLPRGAPDISATEILAVRFASPTVGAAPQVRAPEPTRSTDRRESPTVIVDRGTTRRTIMLGGVVAVFATALILVVVTLWPQAEPPAKTASPRPAAVETQSEPVLPSGPVLNPVIAVAPRPSAPSDASASSAQPPAGDLREQAPTSDAAGPDLAPADAKVAAEVVPASAKVEPVPSAAPEPVEPPAPAVSPTAPPKPKAPKPKAKPTMVEVRLAPHFAEGELRIGKKTFAITKTIDVMLPAGTHSIAWRLDASSSWRKAGRLHLSPGNLYTVRLGASGVLVSSSPKGPP